jgi:cell division protein FtsX
MSVDGSPSRSFRVPRGGWTERLLNAAVVIMLIVPPVMALGWLLVNSIFDQF